MPFPWSDILNDSWPNLFLLYKLLPSPALVDVTRLIRRLTGLISKHKISIVSTKTCKYSSNIKLMMKRCIHTLPSSMLSLCIPAWSPLSPVWYLAVKPCALPTISLNLISTHSQMSTLRQFCILQCLIIVMLVDMYYISVLTIYNLTSTDMVIFAVRTVAAWHK